MCYFAGFPINGEKLGDITISMSGLICGRNYLLEVIDNSGKRVWNDEIQAKMNFVVPFEKFKPGTYYVVLNTRKGNRSVRIIKT